MQKRPSTTSHKILESKIRQIKAVRDAFQNYALAVAAAQEAIGDGPVHGLGTCVMTQEQGESFKCSECAREDLAECWKFCAYCGTEIMRFDRHQEDEAAMKDQVTVKYEKSKTPEETRVYVEMEKPPKNARTKQ
jgi:hypothetical protein